MPKSPEAFNFSTEKGQKKFDKLSEKKQENIIEDSQQEAILIKKILEWHPGGGDLYRGGTEGIDAIVADDEKEALAYSISNSQANTMGNPMGLGSDKGGLTYRQGINVSDGVTDIVVKPFRIWRDGENQAKDKPENHFFIEEFKKAGKGVFDLVLTNGTNDVHLIKVDLNGGKSEVVEKLKKSEYFERKEGKTTQEKYELITQKVYEILKQSNPRGYNGMDVFVLDKIKRKISELSPYWPDEYHEAWEKKIKDLEEVFDNPKEKLLILKTDECLYGSPERGKLFKADPSSAEVEELAEWKYGKGGVLGISLEFDKKKGALILESGFLEKKIYKEIKI